MILPALPISTKSSAKARPTLSVSPASIAFVQSCSSFMTVSATLSLCDGTLAGSARAGLTDQQPIRTRTAIVMAVIICVSIYWAGFPDEAARLARLRKRSTHHPSTSPLLEGIHICRVNDSIMSGPSFGDGALQRRDIAKHPHILRSEFPG